MMKFKLFTVIQEIWVERMFPRSTMGAENILLYQEKTLGSTLNTVIATYIKTNKLTEKHEQKNIVLVKSISSSHSS